MGTGTLCGSLAEALRQEKAVYEQLLTYALEKKEAVTGGDIVALKNICTAERKLLRELASKEEERTALISSILGANAPPQESTMEMVLAKTNGLERMELRKIRQEFTAVIKKLSGANKANKTLIETQLEYARACVQIMARAGDGGIYGNGGAWEEAAKEPVGLLDRTV